VQNPPRVLQAEFVYKTKNNILGDIITPVGLMKLFKNLKAVQNPTKVLQAVFVYRTKIKWRRFLKFRKL
jgi:hypothetical protein